MSVPVPADLPALVVSRALRLALAAALAGLAAGAMVPEWRSWMPGFLVGGGAGALLLGTLPWELASYLRPAGEQRVRFGIFLALIKYPAIAAMLFPLFVYRLVDPAGFAAGFTFLLGAMLASAVRELADAGEGGIR